MVDRGVDFVRAENRREQLLTSTLLASNTMLLHYKYKAVFL